MNISKRKRWDDGLAQYEEVYKPSNNVQLVSIETKSPMNFKNREFLDKRIFFKEQGVYYIYITFAPDKVISFL